MNLGNSNYGDLNDIYSKFDEIENTVIEPVDKKESPTLMHGVKDKSDQQIPLIISIVAGVLIVFIVIILIVLKCSAKSQELTKMEEAKTYASLNQTPAAMGAGTQNCGKAGDRRPIAKKERKDVKEWYV